MAKASGKSLEDVFGNSGSSIEKLKALKQSGDRVGGGGSSQFYKLPDGTTEIRILPAINDEDAFYYATAYHYINNKYVYCLKYKDEDASCPICSHASKVWKRYKESADERIADEAKSLFAKQQFIYNAVVRNQEKGDSVVALQTGKGVKDDLVGICLDESYGDITHPVRGRGLGIRRKGTGKSTSYQVLVRDRSLLAGDEDDSSEAVKLINALLDKRKVLHELVKYPTEEESEKELRKYLDATSGEETDETTTTSKASSKNEDVSEEDKDTFDEIEKQLSKAKSKRGK